MGAETETREPEVEPKQRILEAAIRLFARQSFAGTGVRQIAGEAGVNLAMVSYYYGSKVGVLEAIIEEAFGLMGPVITKNLCTSEVRTLEERIHSYFTDALVTVHHNRDLVRVAVTEFPYDVPQIAQLKADRAQEVLLPVIQALMDELTPGDQGLRPEVVGPTLSGMVFFHALAAPVLARITGAELDEQFYRDYANQLADLVLHGLLAAGKQPRRGS
jgi:TetR/AcrR family transcriptional regulator